MSSEVNGDQQLKATTLNNGLWRWLAGILYSAMSSSYVTYICYARRSLLCARGSDIHFFLNSALVVRGLKSKETSCKIDTCHRYIFQYYYADTSASTGTLKIISLASHTRSFSACSELLTGNEILTSTVTTFWKHQIYFDKHSNHMPTTTTKIRSDQHDDHIPEKN